MSTLHEQILEGVQTAVSGIAGVVTVDRSRKIGLDRDQVPAIVVRPGEEQDERMGSFTDKHRFLVFVIVHTRGDPWDVAADPIVLQAHKNIMANAALKALATDVRRVACEAEDQEEDNTAGIYTMHYEFTYLTRADDLSASP